MEIYENLRYSVEMQNLNDQDTGTKKEEGIDKNYNQILLFIVKSFCCKIMVTIIFYIQKFSWTLIGSLASLV